MKGIPGAVVSGLLHDLRANLRLDHEYAHSRDTSQRFHRRQTSVQTAEPFDGRDTIILWQNYIPCFFEPKSDFLPGCSRPIEHFPLEFRFPGQD